MQALLHRTLSLFLAFVLTVGVFGSIDQLAQPDAGAPQWAQGTHGKPGAAAPARA
jgi:hypothetical protein